MPIYEYTCSQCTTSFEHLARSISAPPPECPKCGAPDPEKQLSVFSTSSSDTAGGIPDACAAGACATGDCPTSGSCPFS
ncbi:MAG: zinc ribbon domain-containing protein [Lentisphaerae bacterium]|nr:zinc ribbon domain-containing protein [Lentisphaerota bacterium]